MRQTCGTVLVLASLICVDWYRLTDYIRKETALISHSMSVTAWAEMQLQYLSPTRIRRFVTKCINANFCLYLKEYFKRTVWLFGCCLRSTKQPSNRPLTVLPFNFSATAPPALNLWFHFCHHDAIRRYTKLLNVLKGLAESCFQIIQAPTPLLQDRCRLCKLEPYDLFWYIKYQKGRYLTKMQINREF